MSFDLNHFRGRARDIHIECSRLLMKQEAIALWAEGGWKLKLTRVHATEYGIYGTKYLLV